MRSSSSIRLFLLLVFAVPVTAYAVFIMLEKRYRKLPVLGKGTVENGRKIEHRIPAFQLTNQDGRETGIDEWNNRIVVADFFFTRCPSICPKMTRSLQKIQSSFSRDEIVITSFSIDPGTDNPGELKSYAGKFRINTTNWQLLTGDKKKIYTLARNGFMIVATDGDGGPGDFIHSENLVLVDKLKRIRGYYDGTDENAVNTLIEDIKKLKHEN